MAGGTFTKGVGKIRPGTYINHESVKPEGARFPERGTVLLPFIKHSWGPTKKFITVNATARDDQFSELGYHITDDNDNMLMLREALKKASKVIVYTTGGGTAATATNEELTITAKYGGVRGNDISVVVEDEVGTEKKAVSVFLGTERVSKYTGLDTVEELITAAAADKFVTFTGTGALTAAPGIKLESGADSEGNNQEITDFIDKMEGVLFNVLCFPVTEASLHTAMKAKIVYMRDNMGRGVQAVVPNMTNPNHESIINVTNRVVVDGKELTAAQTCAWVAGASAVATCLDSLTFMVYEGATEIVDPKDNEAAEAAILNGEFFFSYSDAREVVVEYDINSLLNFAKPKDESYRKNRVVRTLDTIDASLKQAFPPNRYDNDPTDWQAMTGIGKSILKQYGPTPDGIGAIKNIDLDADFVIDEVASKGDETYITVGIEPVDSAEKIYITVQTR